MTSYYTDRDGDSSGEMHPCSYLPVELRLHKHDTSACQAHVCARPLLRQARRWSTKNIIVCLSALLPIGMCLMISRLQPKVRCEWTSELATTLQPTFAAHLTYRLVLLTLQFIVHLIWEPTVNMYTRTPATEATVMVDTIYDVALPG